MKGDGFASHLGWLGGDDAFLAIDLDGNGRIESARELSFALWTAAPDDSDLDGLRAVFDTDKDGSISVADARFSQLRVWQDRNGDGITDPGELRTLAQAGIASLSLTAAGSDWASGGNRVRGFTTYTRADGSRGMAADVELGYTGAGWTSSVSANLVKLTQSGGLAFGMAAANLALDVDAVARGLSGVVGGAGADALKATGAAAVLLQGGAGNDTLLGGTGDDWLSGGEGVDVLRGGAGDDVLLIDAQDRASSIDGGVGFDIAVVTGNAGITLDLGLTNLEAAIGGDGNDSVSNSGYGRVVLAGGAGNDSLSGGYGDDVLQGGRGDDRLRDTAASNDTYLYSRGDGRDTLEDWYSTGAGDRLVLADITAREATVTRSGSDLVLDFGQGDRVTVVGHYRMGGSQRLEQIQFADGTVWGRWDLGALVRGSIGGDALGSTAYLEDNIYIGGLGNDIITDTGGGNDSYVFARGDGQDAITDGGVSENNDRLLIKGIRPEEVSLSRSGADLVLDMGGGDRVTVKRHFESVGFNVIERVEFDGGAAWTTRELALAPVRGSAGADALRDLGVSKEDNTYIGGKGNDAITDADGGNDTYVFARGDGQDVVTDLGMSAGVDRIRLTDITARQTHLARSGDDLLVMFGSGDQLTIRKHFSMLGWNKIEQIDFADGSSWTSGRIDAAPALLQSTAAADVYRVGKGAGSLAIAENAPAVGAKDVLQFTGATSSQLWFARETDDLRVRVIGTNDSVLLQDWYLGSPHQVEQFTSGEGRQLSNSDVNLLVQAMAQFAPPAVGQTVLPQAQQAALAPQLAVAWH